MGHGPVDGPGRAGRDSLLYGLRDTAPTTRPEVADTDQAPDRTTR